MRVCHLSMQEQEERHRQLRVLRNGGHGAALANVSNDASTRDLSGRPDTAIEEPAMRSVASAARRALNSIGCALVAGAPLTAELKARVYALLEDIRANDGVVAKGDAAARIRTICLARAGSLLAKSMRAGGASPSDPRGVSAAQLRAVHKAWLESHKGIA